VFDTELFVRLKLAGPVAPVAVAVTVYEPTVPFAVNVGDVATPLLSVVACALADPPVKVPLAPALGAVNVTTIPLVGFPLIVTVALNGEANAVFTVALCGVPPLAEMTSDEPAVLVKSKFAGVEIPVAVAVTV